VSVKEERAMTTIPGLRAALRTTAGLAVGLGLALAGLTGPAAAQGVPYQPGPGPSAPAPGPSRLAPLGTSEGGVREHSVEHRRRWGGDWRHDRSHGSGHGYRPHYDRYDRYGHDDHRHYGGYPRYGYPRYGYYYGPYGYTPRPVYPGQWVWNGYGWVFVPGY
jgi:hypothetical protein